MKSILIKFGVLTILGLTIFFMWKRINDLNRDLDNAVNNEKAYAAENSGLKENNQEFKLTLDQMGYYKDSIFIAMKSMAKELKIKDKNIKSLQYQLEHFSKRDTLILRDTIFKDVNFVLDTCISDKWNKSCLYMRYPNFIALNNSYINEKYLIINTRRETIKPRKWFLSRWFSKKHTIAEITVVDLNPYVTTPKQRFVEIIK